MKMSRIVCVFLSVLLVFSMAACSSTSNKDAVGNNSSVATTAEKAATTSEKAETTANSKYANSDTIYFGSITVLTGDKAIQGQYAKESGDLFIKHINEAGGVLGKKVEIVYEDEGASEQGSINAALKLLSRGDLSGIYGSTISSSNNIAVMPTMLEHKMPLMAGGSSVNIVKEENPYAWMCRMSDDLTGISMAKASVESLEMKRPAILHGNDSFGVGLAEETINALKNNYGITPCKVISYTPGEMQYSPLLAQIIIANPDGLIAVSHPQDAGIIMKQAAEMKIDLPRIGSTSYCSQVSIDSAGKASDGWYSVGDWTNDIQSPKGKAFVEEYRKAYGHDPDFTGVYLYDSFLCLTEAIKIANSTEPEKVNEALSKIKDVEGLVGKYSGDPNGVLGQTKFLTVNENGIGKLKDTITR